MAIGYYIGEARVVKRVSVYATGKAEIEFRRHGLIYPTRAEAIRAWMVCVEPSLANAPDAFVAKHFAVAVRNQLAKCIKVTL